MGICGDRGGRSTRNEEGEEEEKERKKVWSSRVWKQKRRQKASLWSNAGT